MQRRIRQPRLPGVYSKIATKLSLKDAEELVAHLKNNGRNADYIEVPQENKAIVYIVEVLNENPKT
jgi:hypothetical protein